MRGGVWATQVHNEVELGRAFQVRLAINCTPRWSDLITAQTAGYGYLVFTADKFGQQVGYARVAGQIGTSSLTNSPDVQGQETNGTINRSLLSHLSLDGHQRVYCR